MDRQRLKDQRGTVFIRGMRMEGVLVHNTVRKTREKLLMTKTELARVAGISPLTVDRTE